MNKVILYKFGSSGFSDMMEIISERISCTEDISVMASPQGGVMFCTFETKFDVATVNKTLTDAGVPAYLVFDVTETKNFAFNLPDELVAMLRLEKTPEEKKAESYDEMFKNKNYAAMTLSQLKTAHETLLATESYEELIKVREQIKISKTKNQTK